MRGVVENVIEHETGPHPDVSERVHKEVGIHFRLGNETFVVLPDLVLALGVSSYRLGNGNVRVRVHTQRLAYGIGVPEPLIGDVPLGQSVGLQALAGTQGSSEPVDRQLAFHGRQVDWHRKASSHDRETEHGGDVHCHEHLKPGHALVFWQ
jgi:hypothetical protein